MTAHTSQCAKELNDMRKLAALYRDDTGAAGYMLAWLLGVPGSVLFLIFLLRGCN